jgi:DNA-directed RNA polymerase subunit RPC12/RpoP
MLQGLEGLQTKYMCGSCGTSLLRTANFDYGDMSTLINNLTGSCPNCRKILTFASEKLRFIFMSSGMQNGTHISERSLIQIAQNTESRAMPGSDNTDE